MVLAGSDGEIVNFSYFRTRLVSLLRLCIGITGRGRDNEVLERRPRGSGQGCRAEVQPCGLGISLKRPALRAVSIP